MKDKKGDLRQKSKKNYTKPELRKIPLRPEESVLGFCKTLGSYGPVIYHCQIIITCYTLGS